MKLNWRSYSDVVLLLFLGLSLSLNVFLGWKVIALTPRSASKQASIGTVVPILRARDTSGKSMELSFRKDRPTIIYIFRPGCKWCAANLDNIRILSQERKSTVDFVGISTTDKGLNEYLRKYPLPFPAYVLSETAVLSRMDFVGTPQTVEVSPLGTITNNWTGAYGATTAASIEHRFGVKLPGLNQAEE